MSYDVLDNLQFKEIKCLDKGFVRIVDVMPRIVDENTTMDSAIVQMARVSYGEGTKTIREDRGLIRYLVRNHHTSPLESIEFKFHIKLPIFVMRQIVRHRTASINEYSARYSIIKDEFYIPEISNIKKQSTKNKQCRNEDDNVEDSIKNKFIKKYINISNETYNVYSDFINYNIARELARAVLPVNYYTECYWKIDLNNLLKFLLLRNHPHAQYETRVYASAIEEFVKVLCPLTYEAYVDYIKCSVSFSKTEKDILDNILIGFYETIKYLENNKNILPPNIVEYLDNLQERLKNEMDRENLSKFMSKRDEVNEFLDKIKFNIGK